MKTRNVGPDPALRSYRCRSCLLYSDQASLWLRHFQISLVLGSWVGIGMLGMVAVEEVGLKLGPTNKRRSLYLIVFDLARWIA